MRIFFIIVLIMVLVTGCSTRNEPKQSSTVQHVNGHKVVVIVVDSLTNQAIHTAMNDNKFAALRYLVRNGQYSPNIVASFPSMSVSDLSTVVTGASPDEHRIPGLVWFDTKRNMIVNYGNNFWQTITIGTRTVSQNALYELNQTHLSKDVRTIFEDLQDAGYSTGAINMLIYRGRTPHQLKLPAYTRPFTQTDSYTVLGPDTLTFGGLTSQSGDSTKAGVFDRFGMNDDFATDALLRLIKQGKLPDFTMVYLPSNDTVMHKHGVNSMKGITNVDKNIRKILDSYGTWDNTLRSMTLIVMGDGGVTRVLPKQEQPTIFLKDLLPKYAIYRWGKTMDVRDDIALAVNSRMAYVYLLNDHERPDEVANQLRREKRIDLISWFDGNKVFVTTPEDSKAPLSFYKKGPITDPYEQTWRITGNPSILDITMGQNHTITYGKYPDVLHQLWSAAHCQTGKYLIVTAKKGYQFGDEDAPKHDGGAQQASLLAEDVFAPVIINGTQHVLK
ncbi:alkaline phosphatase family protein [Alicyclobacillus fastidiosus]|nr:alkaline phosphatase family protein [Alicyclobacillus fastidiosus]